jgi:hypothetical protein
MMCDSTEGGNYLWDDETYNFCSECSNSLDKWYARVDPSGHAEYGTAPLADWLNPQEFEDETELLKHQKLFKDWVASGKIPQ